jgi:hypothetical protein
VDRWHGPGCPAFEYYEIKDLWGLPTLLGV